MHPASRKQLKRQMLHPNSWSSALILIIIKEKWGNDRTIMPPFYKSAASLSSSLTSWKMKPFPVNSPSL
jgi:hypothetical protein